MTDTIKTTCLLKNMEDFVAVGGVVCCKSNLTIPSSTRSTKTLSLLTSQPGAASRLRDFQRMFWLKLRPLQR